MAKYKVDWSKTYHASGQVYVEADSIEEAEDYVYDNMGDYTGNTQYDPNEDYAEVVSWDNDGEDPDE